MLLVKLLLQHLAEYKQTAIRIVALGEFRAYHYFACTTFGARKGTLFGCRELQSEDIACNLRGKTLDGVHEGACFQSMLLYLQECLFPTACQLHIGDLHILYCLIDVESLLGRYKCLA